MCTAEQLITQGCRLCTPELNRQANHNLKKAVGLLLVVYNLQVIFSTGSTVSILINGKEQLNKEEVAL